jgi:Polyprenyl synthetase
MRREPEAYWDTAGTDRCLRTNRLRPACGRPCLVDRRCRADQTLRPRGTFRDILTTTFTSLRAREGLPPSPCRSNRAMNSLSGFLEAAVRKAAPHILTECENRIAEIAKSHQSIAEALNRNAKGRASYLMPQLFLEIGYGALAGHPMDGDLRSRGAAFSLLCLSCGVADDLIDSAAGDFQDRMALGCSALALAGHAWEAVAQDCDECRRRLLSNALSSFVADGIKTAYEEIRYSLETEFSLPRYLAISSKKATVYTHHSLLVAHALSHSDESLREPLKRLGQSAGLAFQLIDDALDARADRASGAASTYATILISADEPLDPLYVIVDQQLSVALDVCGLLPYPEQLSSLLEELRWYISLHSLY